MPSTTDVGQASGFAYSRRLDSANGEIRLLVVKPGRSADFVHCDIRYAFLGRNQEPLYETISYTWGDSRQRGMIYIRDFRLDVPASSEDVLRRMRFPDNERILWIDAICINQNDLVERGEQVGLMALIYTKTCRNLIWLGEYDYLPELAIEAVETVLGEARRSTENLEHFAESVLSADGAAFLASDKNLSTHMDTGHWEALARLFASPWFQRVWVFQEAALASSNVCSYGEFELPLIDIARTAVWLWHNREFIPSIWSSKIVDSNLLILWQYTDSANGFMKGRGEKSVQLMDLFSGFQNLKAQDPRDHVYGVLGLWQKAQDVPKLPSELEPNYQKDFQDVFREATRFALGEKRDLDYFEEVRPWSTDWGDQPQMSSWVPAWHVAVQPIDPYFLSGAFKSCGKHNKVGPMYGDENQNTLLVAGIICDTVASVLSVILANSGGSKRSAMVRKLDQALDSIGHNQDQRSEVIAMTLVAGCDYRGQLIAPETAMDRFNSWLVHVSTHEDHTYVEMHDILQHTDIYRVYEYDAAFAKGARNRSVYLTTNGRLGAGPQNSRESDVVAILWGCKWPVVLRPLLQEGDYEILGVSYVHGIMFGEAVEEADATGQTETIFRLK